MRLTNRVLFGLHQGLARGSAELEVIADELPGYAEEFECVQDGAEWVRDEISRRAASVGIDFLTWIHREQFAAEKRSRARRFATEAP